MQALWIVLLSPLLMALTPSLMILASFLVLYGVYGGEEQIQQTNKFELSTSGWTSRTRELRASLLLLLVVSQHAPVTTAMRTGERGATTSSSKTIRCAAAATHAYPLIFFSFRR